MKTTKIVCKIDIKLDKCKNIYEILDKYLNESDFKERRKHSNYEFCSKMNICRETKFDLNKIFYINKMKNGKVKENWSSDYTIPSKLNRHLLSYPIAFDFKTINDLFRYHHQECRKFSMIYVVQEPFEKKIFFWYFSFFYLKTFIEKCETKDNLTVQCLPKLKKMNLGSYFPQNIVCKKPPESGFVRQISEIPGLLIIS